FVTQDRANFGNAVLSMTGKGTYILTRDSAAAGAAGLDPGDYFNLQWLSGSYIGINGGHFSVYQVLSHTFFEITEDGSGALVGTVGGMVPWSTPEGTLKHGTPVPHIWGPYSTGQTGAYIFGVGNPEAPGDLYWTNGNDPDACDVVNSITVTSGTEP